MTGYELSRQWFDFAFENPEKINPNHTAMYFFAIEHCNRLGWKKKFGFPSTMVMEAMGVKSYNTYKKTLDDLVNWGFFTMVEKSKNQYSSNIIALSKNNKALDKALDKALSKHDAKQSESKESIDKQLNKQTKNNITKPSKSDLIEYFSERGDMIESDIPLEAENFINHYEEREWKNSSGKKITEWKRQAGTWNNNYQKFNSKRLQQIEVQPSYYQEL